ncbi:hypothetical protein [Sphingosinicella sp.]|uniref:hypothetical protein n=1 Tax=Sphingosinicella sp. TaxID=1917971 RepID=UPI0040380DF2
MSGTLLSVMMLGVFALAAGGLYLLRTGRERAKAALMLVAALVLFGNVLLLSL